MEAEGDDEEEGMSIQLQACQRLIEGALVSEDQKRRTDLATTTYLLVVGFNKVKDGGVESPRSSPEYPTLVAVKKFVCPPLLC
uniref:Uncharacterized protein n=1 Tax=Oryza meridionalis TaxID=40149 RepID=A0A0E0E288_9ORYZ